MKTKQLTALAIVAAFALAGCGPESHRRYHVTCPFDVFDGEVRSTFDGKVYSEETGNRLHLPDNCVWERLPE